MAHFEASVQQIIFRNELNGYTVLKGISEGKEHTLVGFVPDISPGERIVCEGHEVNHSVYGSQFVIESYSISGPESKSAIERYLASGGIKGIRASLASRIVKRFGADALKIISEEPERLSEIKGISKRKAKEIASSLNERQDVQEALMFLQGYGISLLFARRIYDRYGNRIYDIIRENPYILAMDIEGIGFRHCDEIAARMGINSDSEYRISSGIVYVLDMAEQEGHCFLPAKLLHERTEALLSIRVEDLRHYLVDLQMKRLVMVKGERVYRAFTYYTELSAAAKLHELMNAFRKTKEESEDILKAKYGEEIELIAREEKIELDNLQFKAVLSAISHGVLVLTGGPGTGKTTTIRVLLRYFSDKGLEVLLAAPTGRAAKRMSEATGWEAKTIHRLLEYQGRPMNENSENEGGEGVNEWDTSVPGQGRDGERGRAGQRRKNSLSNGDWHFERNEDNPLETGLLIVDEMSMVDIFLMNSLLKAISPGTRLILVGDKDQLPSVGAGNVLKDIIDSGVVPTIRLKHIFRQALESDIVLNAHRVNKGEEVALGKPSKDFLFIRGENPNRILESIAVLMTEKLPRYLGVSSTDIQVLTPQRKGILGVERLNSFLQERLNPPDSNKAELELFGIRYRVHDKVMQIRNNYNISWEIRGLKGIAIEKGEGIFNGDIGVISGINNFTESMTVCFDDRVVEYPFSECGNLDLAYAITVHKSQGSEYPAVVMPMYMGPKMLMNRNILYTALTRAKSLVCLIGNPQAFETMLHNESESLRYSSLCDRLRDITSKES